MGIGLGMAAVDGAASSIGMAAKLMHLTWGAEEAVDDEPCDKSMGEDNGAIGGDPDAWYTSACASWLRDSVCSDCVSG